MTAVSHIARHRRSGIVILCSIFAALSMLFILPPDSAMAADAVDVCNPTSDNGCVNGILQDADKKAIAGIAVKLSGTEEAETTTDADGKWAFSVKDDGDYTVTIDESVAEEHGLKSSSATRGPLRPSQRLRILRQLVLRLGQIRLRQLQLLRHRNGIKEEGRLQHRQAHLATAVLRHHLRPDAWPDVSRHEPRLRHHRPAVVLAR